MPSLAVQEVLSKGYMERHVAIAYNDRRILGDLCGVNDSNLRVLEDLLGVKVFSRGNEILVETENESTRHVFASVLGRLEEHIRLGQLPGPDLIRAIHESISSGNSEKADFLTSKHIAIPNGIRKVFPRSYNQALYLDYIDKSDMVFAVGPAGTGKTYLAIAQTLKAVLGRVKRKLILTRPVVEAGESLGYLPGDLEQKINPYLRPLYDAMQSLVPFDLVKRLEENGIIEIAPLAYMRGRTLSDCAIILDEAQNTTREQMKMFLTRIGEGSRTIITGDITQIDLPRKRESGLLDVISLLKEIEEIRFIFFDKHDVVRHPLVQKIVHAYENSQAD